MVNRMDDLISRQAALDIAYKYCPDDDGVCSKAGCDPREMLDEIEALPPAQPEERTETHGVCLDVIDRQAAIDTVDEALTRVFVEHRDIAEKMINKIPSAQPHITHCAECRHWQHSDVRKNYCEVFDWMNEAEDFCSFAERRTDEQAD